MEKSVQGKKSFNKHKQASNTIENSQIKLHITLNIKKSVLRILIAKKRDKNVIMRH